MNDLSHEQHDEYATSPAPATVRLERLLPGPIERVWAYLTEADKRATWFAGGPMEMREGGSLELHFNHANLSSEKTPPERFQKESSMKMASVVTACDPPHKLAYTMFGDSEVTFELSPKGANVLVVVTHRRLPSRDMMVMVAGGWDAHFGILADRIAGKEPRGFWSTNAALQKVYETRL